MTYIFVYSNSFGDREAVKSILNSIPAVQNWRYDLPNTFYIVSDKTANELATLIMAKRPNKRFIIAEISKGNRQGWLPKDTWNFLNNK